MALLAEAYDILGEPAAGIDRLFIVAVKARR
jgi:hypothetical protein